MNSPLVSVVIPAYNQAEFLGDTIQSVLDQTYQNFEIIVVNDLSTDNTHDVVSRFNDPRIKYIVHEKNMRLPETRNTGMRASQGEIIAFLDADDLFHPDKLLKHVDFLEKHPEVGVTYNPRFEFNYSSKSIRGLSWPPRTVGLKDLILGFPFAPSDTVLRRDWAFQVGLFDPAMGSAEDTDFPCRLALAGCKFACVDQTLNYRRYHSGRGRKNLPGRLDDVNRALNAVFSDPRCPGDVLAIRDVAIKHHLMVIVSLALIQEETELAKKYAFELIRLDPSVLEGDPCELVEFLMMESIADENLDHKLLLRKIFAQLPSEIQWLSSQFEWAVTYGYLLKGIRAIFWNRLENGQNYLALAREFHAKIDERLLQLITHQLLSYEKEFGAEATLSVLKRLTSNLNQVDSQHQGRKLAGSYLINHAFQNYRSGEYSKVPAEVFQALASDPSYLINRGVITILIRSMTSKANIKSNA